MTNNQNNDNNQYIIKLKSNVMIDPENKNNEISDTENTEKYIYAIKAYADSEDNKISTTYVKTSYLTDNYLTTPKVNDEFKKIARLCATNDPKKLVFTEDKDTGMVIQNIYDSSRLATQAPFDIYMHKVALTGSYDDLSSKPVFPIKYITLSSRVGYLSEANFMAIANESVIQTNIHTAVNSAYNFHVILEFDNKYYNKVTKNVSYEGKPEKFIDFISIENDIIHKITISTTPVADNNTNQYKYEVKPDIYIDSYQKTTNKYTIYDIGSHNVSIHNSQYNYYNSPIIGLSNSNSSIYTNIISGVKLDGSNNIKKSNLFLNPFDQENYIILNNNDPGNNIYLDKLFVASDIATLGILPENAATTAKNVLKMISSLRASTDKFGGIKLGYANNGKNYQVSLDNSGKAYVAVPWEKGMTDTEKTTYAKSSEVTTAISNHTAVADKKYPILEKDKFNIPRIPTKYERINVPIIYAIEEASSPKNDKGEYIFNASYKSKTNNSEYDRTPKNGDLVLLYINNFSGLYRNSTNYPLKVFLKFNLATHPEMKNEDPWFSSYNPVPTELKFLLTDSVNYFDGQTNDPINKHPKVLDLSKKWFLCHISYGNTINGTDGQKVISIIEDSSGDLMKLTPPEITIDGSHISVVGRSDWHLQTFLERYKNMGVLKLEILNRSYHGNFVHLTSIPLYDITSTNANLQQFADYNGMSQRVISKIDICKLMCSDLSKPIYDTPDPATQQIIGYEEINDLTHFSNVKFLGSHVYRTKSSPGIFQQNGRLSLSKYINISRDPVLDNDKTSIGEYTLSDDIFTIKCNKNYGNLKFRYIFSTKSNETFATSDFSSSEIRLTTNTNGTGFDAVRFKINKF